MESTRGHCLADANSRSPLVGRVGRRRHRHALSARSATVDRLGDTEERVAGHSSDDLVVAPIMPSTTECHQKLSTSPVCRRDVTRVDGIGVSALWMTDVVHAEPLRSQPRGSASAGIPRAP